MIAPVPTLPEVIVTNPDGPSSLVGDDFTADRLAQAVELLAILSEPDSAGSVPAPRETRAAAAKADPVATSREILAQYDEADLRRFSGAVSAAVSERRQYILPHEGGAHVPAEHALNIGAALQAVAILRNVPVKVSVRKPPMASASPKRLIYLSPMKPRVERVAHLSTSAFLRAV